MEKRTVEHSIWINAPRERVWQAITETDQIRQWWQDYWEITALEVGATIKFGAEGDMILAKVAVVDRPREFAIQWPPHLPYNAIEVTTRYLLEEENGGTRVTVSENGFEALPEETRQERYESTAQGYATVMADLKAYIEAGSNPA